MIAPVTNFLDAPSPNTIHPADTLARAAQYRNLLLQGQQHQQQILNEQEVLKQHQLANEETVRSQADAANFENVLREKGSNVQDAIADAAKRGNVRIKYLNQVRDEYNKQVQQTAATDSATTTAAEKRADLLHELFAPVAAVKDQAQQKALFDAKQDQAIKDRLIQPGDRIEYTNPQDVDNFVARNAMEKHVLVAGKEKRETDAAANAATAAGDTHAKQVLDITDKRAQDLAVQLSKAANQQEYDNILKTADPKAAVRFPTVYDPKTTPQKVIQLAMNPEQLSQQAHQEADLAQRTVNEAATRQEAKQRLYYEGQKNKRDQMVYDQTYGEGSNEALRGVEPKLRVPATKEAQRAADDYNKAQATAADMQTFLDLAKGGNKAAGTNLPIATVGMINAVNGIKRSNRAEIAQNEHMGNLYDKAVGTIQGLVVGQPIPANIIDSIDQLHKALEGNTTESYNRKLEGINQNYKSQFKPVPGATKPTSQGGGPQVHGVYDPATGKIIYQ